MNLIKSLKLKAGLLGLGVLGLLMVIPAGAHAAGSSVTDPQNGSVGLTGTLPGPPPTQGATIESPSNGQSFTTLPVTVDGLCPSGLLVKVLINNVFSGSSECNNGSWSVSVSLFSGSNSIVAIDYDALNQAGPSSGTVNVKFSNIQATGGTSITLTSTYAKLGASPGSTLTWPIIIAGGAAPYAISVDWGDNTTSELLSRSSSGTFNITHVYSTAGVYTVLIKATDTNGNVAYLQLVGVANGPTSQSSGSTSTKAGGASTSTKSTTKITTTVIYTAGAVAILVPIITFWLGRRHQLFVIRKRLETGKRPF
jgi:hypothetical protein